MKKIIKTKSIQTKLVLLFFITIVAFHLTSCSGLLPKEPTQIVYVTTIYRGVDANSNNGKAKLSPSQFRFNPDMSTFNAATYVTIAKDCWYTFTVTVNEDPPPAVGHSGQVNELPPGYIATFDNDPPGHWSVAHPANVTADAAKVVVAQYAQANRGNLVNGTRADCN